MQRDTREDGHLKEAFQMFDTNCDGRLSFDEFYALLQKGIPDFPEMEAQELFREADNDLSGTVDFNEFVDYIYGNLDFNDYVKAQVTANEKEIAEQEAKKKCLHKPLKLRSETAKLLAHRGSDWKRMSWQERLNAVTETEIGKRRRDSSCVPERPPSKPKRRVSVYETMTQEATVDYCIHRYDLSFAGREYQCEQQELHDLRLKLRTSGGPEEFVDIKRYVAKGTAGWIFEVDWKESGERKAMKLIRMSQSISGLKEWFASKILKQAGLDHIVYTHPTVCVVNRDLAPAVIKEQLLSAGPVNFYLCLFQDFAGGGDLEDLRAEGRLTPKMMLGALVDVASTLAKMHDRGVHHRDVKPENVLVETDGETITSAKICDLGCVTFLSDQEGCKDDIRRFGVTLFSLATGEPWTSNRLIHENHDDLVDRMAKFVAGSSDATKELPEVLRQILSGGLNMHQVAEMMLKMREALQNEVGTS